MKLFFNKFINCIEKALDDYFSYHVSEEKLFFLNSIISKVVISNDSCKLKNELVNFLGKIFKADRCFVDDYDHIKRKFAPSNYEYLSDFEKTKNKESDFHRFTVEFNKLSLKDKEIIFYKRENFIKKNLLNETGMNKTLQDLNIKSCFYAPIKDNKEIIGMLGLIYTKKRKFFRVSEIELIRKICEKIGSAIKQIEINIGFEKAVEREIVIRKIIKKIGSAFDQNEIKKSFVTNLGKYLKASRVAISVFDEKENIFLPFDEDSVYLSSADFPDLIGYDWTKKELRAFIEPLKKGKEVNFSDLDEYINKNHLQNTEIYKLFKSAKMNSSYNIPVQLQGKIKGYFSINYEKKGVALDKIHLNFLRIISEHLAFALYHAKLHENENLALNREKLLRKIISLIRSSLDIDEIKHKIVKFVGKAFNADRCVINEFDNETGKFLPVKFQYLKSLDEISLIGFDSEEQIPEICDFMGQGKEFLAYDFENYLKEIGYEGSKSLDSHKKNNVKSDIALPIIYKGKLYGTFVMHFTKEKKYLEKNELNFIRVLATQTGQAIYQAELYSSEKKVTERERLLRKIIEATRETPDLKKVKQKIVDETGKVFNADRCYFRSYDKIKGIWYKAEAEYRFSADIPSVLETEPNQQGITYFTDRSEKGKPPFVIKDIDKYIIENNLKGSFLEKYLKELRIKSDYPFPVWDRQQEATYLVLHYTKKPVQLSDDDINFLETVASEAASAIDLTQSYKKIQKTAEKEALLRHIIETIRSSIDIDKTLSIICDEIGKTFNAGRTSIIQFKNPDNYSDWTVKREYKKRLDFKAIKDVYFSPEIGYFWGDKLFDQKQSYLIEKIQEASLPDLLKKTYKEMGLKTILGIPIAKGNEFWGALFLSEYEDTRIWSDEDISFINSIAAQVFIAIKQAELFQKEKETASRERILRESTETIRDTLDINQVKKNITESFGKTFNLDRCFILCYDPLKDTYLPIDEYSEYRSSDEIKSIVGFDFSDPDLYFFVEIGKENIDLYETCMTIDIPDKYKKSSIEAIKNYFKEFSVKSCFQSSIFYRDEFLGLLVGHNVKNRADYKTEDKKFIKSLANQTGIALYQSILYQKQLQTSQKERIIKELLGDIRLSQNIGEVYNYIITKISEIFDIERCFFLEISSEQEEEITKVNYEYLKSDSLISIKNISLPANFLKIFKKAANNLSPLIIENTQDFMPKKTELQEFFKTYKIKSIFAIPFVRYNMRIKILGILALSCSKQRSWNQNEKDIIKSISDSVVNVVWEISKIHEIEEIRNTFTMTLAHDLQVPLIGEKKAIEYLLNRPDSSRIGNYKDFIEAMAKDNFNIVNMLKRLLDVYSIESDKEEFIKGFCVIPKIIDDTVNSLKKIIEDKSISIKLNFEEDLPLTQVDRAQIKKVIYIILENALNYTQENGEITIKCYREQNSIVTQISDNGPGIPEYIKNKIFQRYAMVETLERKVGSGVSLYLAKLIVDAHNGKIWFKTKVAKGTDFYFSIPITE